MKRNKLALLLLLAALAAACSDSYAPVTVPYVPRGVVDFSAFDKLHYIDFVCDVPDLGVDAGAEARRVFLEELPFVTGKEITRLEPEHWGAILGILQRYRLAVDIRYADSLFFQRVFQAQPRALFLVGKLKLAVKKMGVIREVRDGEGGRKNVYDTAEKWEMDLQVQFIDGAGPRVAWEQTFSEKGEPAPGATARFTFNSLLAKLAAKLTTALQPRKALQERYILQK